MQTLESVFRIEEPEIKDNLLEILSDKYCRIILENIMCKPKAVTEIAMETKVPISTIYRRIQMLHDNKLVSTSGSINEDGKKFFMYKSKVKGMQCKFDDGKVEVELVLNK